MKKQHVDHVLRAAGDITGEKEFLIIGSQALHAKHPNLVDRIFPSNEVDLVATKNAERTELLNEIGLDSPFHETFGYYADPVDERTAILPEGWRNRLVRLPPGNTNGVVGLCLDPHDLAIAKYAVRREKDVLFTRELARRGITSRKRLLTLLGKAPVDPALRARMRRDIEADFK